MTLEAPSGNTTTGTVAEKINAVIILTTEPLNKDFFLSVFALWRILTYDLSIRAENGRVLPDWGAGGHETHSLLGRLGFDLRKDDVSTGEIFGLASALSCGRHRQRQNRLEDTCCFSPSASQPETDGVSVCEAPLCV